MSDRDPCALVILAGYFKALTFFEASALVQSTGNKHLSFVYAIIPSEWQPVLLLISRELQTLHYQAIQFRRITTLQYTASSRGLSEYDDKSARQIYQEVKFGK